MRLPAQTDASLPVCLPGQDQLLSEVDAERLTQHLELEELKV